MKNYKSKRSNDKFSSQFVPAEATEALISEKLSKKAAKRYRKREKRQNERINSAPEQKWRKISLSNPPQIIPANKEEDIIEAMPSDNKKKLAYPESIFMGDDLGGFLCLEEIDYVDVEYENNEETQGKTIKFKRVKRDKKSSSAKIKNSCAKPEEPLTKEESSNYYDLDTFDKNLLLGNKEMDESSQSEEDVILHDSSDNNGDQNDESDKDENDESSINNSQSNSEDEMDIDSEIEDRNLNNQSTSTNNNKPTEKGTGQNAIEEEINLSAWNQFNLSSTIMNGLKALKFDKPTPIQEKTLLFSMSGRDVVGAAETGSGKTLAFGIPILEYIINRNIKESENQLAGLILTPTRELAMQVRDHLQNISKTSLIKIMVIVGGMSVQKQQRLLSKHPNIIVATPGRLWELFSENDAYLDSLRRIKFLVLDEADRMLEPNHFEELNHILTVLSRTRINTNEWAEGDMKKKEDCMNAELMHRLEFSDPDPVFLDITPEEAVAEKLQESKIDCLTKEKDLYTYYFITRYPGRTLIFVNSITAIRRLTPIMKLLNIEVFGLHAQMQQRQRLKNLDRFKQNPKAVMIASDVAARGLDIPLVEHVIHYQLPRSSDIYVHRSGRTARARKEGISLILCSPEELSLYRKLCLKLKKTDGLTNFPVDRGILNSMKQRIEFAGQIDQEEHKLQKMNYDNDWIKKAAQEFEVDLDDNVNDSNKGNQRQTKERIRSLKFELNSLLSQPLVPRGTSTKYLTSGIVRDLADRLLDESSLI
ncbi:7537_t:CDS:10 [Funneliformis geosporum]|uniref:ATP-dependent RNA helicase n=1 Tax=Funneliformis geosporum TaxID=1117311 RepID=A0A9W4S9B2_9GLOM|nr:7537_t:CDS:10 [Funneliformis geosporum]